MGFMQKEIYFDTYFEVETSIGTEIVPGDLIGNITQIRADHFIEYLEGDPLDPDELIEPQSGWLARLTAPGYMDCTEWTVHKTEKEAYDYLEEMYCEDDELP